MVWYSKKCCEVVPTHKANAKSNISNYRPISLIAKIFEKIIYNKLYNFLKDYNILSDSQYGFVKRKGTTNALKKITDIIYNHLYKSGHYRHTKLQTLYTPPIH